MVYNSVCSNAMSAVTNFTYEVLGKENCVKLTTFAFNCLMCYSRYFEKCKRFYNNLYKKYSIVQIVSHILGYSYQAIRNIFMNLRTPPFRNKWASMSHIYIRIPETDDLFCSEKPICILQEEFINVNPYDIICEGDTTNAILVITDTDILYEWYKLSCNRMKNNNNLIHDCLLVFNNSADVIIYRTCKPFTEQFDISYDASDLKFLSVEVYLPNSKCSYFIELNPNEYIIGNDLFSPSFIKRYFEYYISKTVFDFDYQLKLMDNVSFDIKILNNQQYIVLEKNGYCIKKL